MANDIVTSTSIFRALSSPHRLKILMWLASPQEHFPPQEYGDLMDDGVCVGFLTEKTGLKQPTVTHHMQILIEAGLVSSKQIKNWVFFKPVPQALDGVMELLVELRQRQ